MASSTRLIVGLGNPGAEYRDTRHNVGFRVVEEMARRRRRAPRAAASATRWWAAIGDALLALPQTFMNRSGYAARCLVERHGLPPAAVLVVLDEVALPLGKLRVRPAGSPGGHRGLESILESLQSDAVRAAAARASARARSRCSASSSPTTCSRPSPPAARERSTRWSARGADACESWLRRGDRARHGALQRRLSHATPMRCALTPPCRAAYNARLLTAGGQSAGRVCRPRPLCSARSPPGQTGGTQTSIGRHPKMRRTYELALVLDPSPVRRGAGGPRRRGQEDGVEQGRRSGQGRELGQAQARLPDRQGHRGPLRVPLRRRRGRAAAGRARWSSG